MGIEWVVVVAVLSVLSGFGLGQVFQVGGKARQQRVTDLEAQLQTAQTELADYRREVYGQFAETADKFRDLDESYQALHRQLATSAVALCGDAATPLLESSRAETLTDGARTETEVRDAEPDEAGTNDAGTNEGDKGEVDAEVTAPAPGATESGVTDSGVTDSGATESETTETRSTQAAEADDPSEPPRASTAEDAEDIVVSERTGAADAPLLTDVDAAPEPEPEPEARPDVEAQKMRESA